MTGPTESAESFPPREEYTNILIDRSGHWYTGDKQIINDHVLHYFRENLQHDEKGVFIWNVFGKFKEKGYIKVHGPVFSVIAINEDGFHINNGHQYSFDQVRLVVDEKLNPFLALNKLGVWAIFPSKVANEFGVLLEEKNGDFYFKGKIVETQEITEWIFDI